MSRPPAARRRPARGRRIVEAAHGEFLERGFHGSTVTSIAKRAKVAPQTVYFVFHTKAELISAVIDAAVMGESDLPPELLRPVAGDGRRAGPRQEPCSSSVRGAADAFERAPSISLVLAGAALTDEELMTRHQQHEQLRRTGFREVMVGIAGKGPLREGLDVESCDRHRPHGLWRRHLPRVPLRARLDTGPGLSTGSPTHSPGCCWLSRLGDVTTYNLATLLETSVEELPRAGGDRLPRHRPPDDVRRGGHVRQHGGGLPGSKGIQPGDKVALSCPNLPYFSLIYWGILKAGATVVPLNVLLKGREVAYHLGDSDAKAFFCFEGTAGCRSARRATPGSRRRRVRAVRHDHRRADGRVAVRGQPDLWARSLGGQDGTFDTVETDEDDTAVILYTSGTTGQPKGAELRHRNMRDNAMFGEAVFGSSAENPTRTCASCPCSTPSARR